MSWTSNEACASKMDLHFHLPVYQLKIIRYQNVSSGAMLRLHVVWSPPSHESYEHFLLLEDLSLCSLPSVVSLCQLPASLSLVNSLFAKVTMPLHIQTLRLVHFLLLPLKLKNELVQYVVMFSVSFFPRFLCTHFKRYWPYCYLGPYFFKSQDVW